MHKFNDQLIRQLLYQDRDSRYPNKDQGHLRQAGKGQQFQTHHNKDQHHQREGRESQMHQILLIDSKGQLHQEIQLNHDQQEPLELFLMLHLVQILNKVSSSEIVKALKLWRKF